MLIALIAFAGCGGEDDSSLSKQEYTKQLQLVCNKGAQERETLVTSISRDYYTKREQRATPEYQAENLLKLVATYNTTTDNIRDIGLPEGDEDTAEAFIQAREEAAAKVEASPLGTRDNLQAIFDVPAEKAQELGVGTCDT
ncbi:MAG TPA: hypothetical protein VFN18_09905 [Solirubrobacterales bacterium]|nr:hypothetical protein [Solirubrobacterales bacterium]